MPLLHHQNQSTRPDLGRLKKSLLLLALFISACAAPQSGPEENAGPTAPGAAQAHTPSATADAAQAGMLPAKTSAQAPPDARQAPTQTAPSATHTPGRANPSSVRPGAEGLEAQFSPEAQRLFAKARLMWDQNDLCSDPPLAQEYLDMVIAMEPTYAAAYMRRALAASELGDWDEAFTDSSQAIRLEPKAEHYAYRGLIFTRQGNYLGARKDLEKALSLEPGQVRARAFKRNLDALEKSQKK